MKCATTEIVLLGNPIPAYKNVCSNESTILQKYSNVTKLEMSHALDDDTQCVSR